MSRNCQQKLEVWWKFVGNFFTYSKKQPAYFFRTRFILLLSVACAWHRGTWPC